MMCVAQQDDGTLNEPFPELDDQCEELESLESLVARLHDAEELASQMQEDSLSTLQNDLSCDRGETPPRWSWFL